jgi:hypothetical protein
MTYIGFLGSALIVTRLTNGPGGYGSCSPAC